MGRVHIPLVDQQPEKKKELPHCAWCGSVSSTICGRCKARAYCSTECQKHDWKAGHQTACSIAPIRQPKPVEEKFVFYHICYIAHWAINIRRWGLQRESREFEYLLSKLPEESREFIAARKRWPAVKIALARELIIRRLAEVLTQGQWHKTKWKHDKATDRDFLVEREGYVWTGEKYTNANKRFPNFNVCICECGEYLFVVSHPAALTGVHAAAPLKKEPLPDPVEEFANQLHAARLEIETTGTEAVETQAKYEYTLTREDVEAVELRSKQDDSSMQRIVESGELQGIQNGPLTREDGDSNLLDEERVVIEEMQECGDVVCFADNAEVQSSSDTCLQAAQNVHASLELNGEVDMRNEETESDICQAMFDGRELLAICAADSQEERQSRLRQALVGKIAYYRTLGEQRGRRWNEVVLEHCPVGAACEGGELGPEHAELHASAEGPRRHHLLVGGMRQNRWRSEVHDFRGYCLVVNRAPPEEAVDPSGEFASTMTARFIDIDQYDKLLEHPEPPFIEVPIIQLLPDDWHSDYKRACGHGEKGEQTRINR